MNYGEVLKKAWKTIWKHKILWLFGILAGCGATTSGNGGGGSGGGSAVYSSSGGSFQNGWNFTGPYAQHPLGEFVQFIVDIPVSVWITVGVVLLILVIGMAILFSVVSLFARTLGKIGVIKGTSLADEAGPDEKPLSFGRIFKEGKAHFWKVLLFDLGLQIIGFFVVLFLVIPLVFTVLCTCGLGILLLILIGWFIEVMVHFSVIAMIEEELGIFKAIGRAWQLVTRNLGHVLVMFLILGVGQIIIGLIIALPLLIVPLPVLINLIATGFEGFTLGLIFSGLLMLVVIPIVIFLSGVLKAYVISCWTLTFRRLVRKDDLAPQELSGKWDEELSE